MDMHLYQKREVGGHPRDCTRQRSGEVAVFQGFGLQSPNRPARFRQALALYDQFLASYPDDLAAPRALESRDTVAAIVTTRDELSRLRSELRARESEAAKLRDEVARLRQELTSRQAESDKLRADLEKMKELDLRLERKTR